MNNNLKHYFLSLSLLVSGVVGTWAANFPTPNGNNGSDLVEERITQLERISNAHSQLLTQLQQQLTDNQRDVDLLYGQIQENQHQLTQVVERQKQIYQQIDSLLRQVPVASADVQSQISTSTSNSQSIITDTTASESDDNVDYNKAIALALEKKQYAQAIDAFQIFVKRYPDSVYQANANYWLGQLNYNQGKKDNAAYYFALVAKNYPKSLKAPDALLKVGIIMQEKGQKDKAKTVYRQMEKLYPSAEANKQAQRRLMELS